MMMQQEAIILPKHIAIVMDGSGRWAKKRGLPRVAGHRRGKQTLLEIVKACVEKNIKALTVYAFSSENWRRPPSEVHFLMKMFQNVLKSEANKLHERNIKVSVIGERLGLSEVIQQRIEQIEFLTQNNTGLAFNIAINYGGRADIARAAKTLAFKVARNELDPNAIDEYLLGAHVCLSHLPEPDFVIRTSGEYRLSNFLLWQISYAELYFSATPWPEFTRQEFEEALCAFSERERRFGHTSEQLTDQIIESHYA